MYGKRWLAIAILSVFGVFASLGATEAGAQSYDAAETETIELINAYRQENGLGPLSLSAPLSVASERHSEDMGTYGFFSHDTVQSSYYEPGWGHSERIAQEGYDFNTFTAENLAYGQATPQEVFEAWRNSPGHNAAMLGDYTVVGIGLVNVGGVPYWTTVFGAEADPSAQPVGASPSSSGTTGGTTGETAPAEEPTAQSDQYDDAQPTDNAADEQYAEDIETEPVAADEQYDDAPNAADEEAPATEQYDDATASPADSSAADQYRANAERLRAAADQYGEESRQAEREIAALQATQSQPEAEPSSTAANAPTANAPTANASAENAPAENASAENASAESAPAASVGTVSPEPQIAAPASAEQEIPVPNVEDAPAVGSAGQSAGGSGESSDVSGGQSEKPSEAMAAVGMTVLPDTGGIPLGSILGAALVVCVLVTTRRFMG